MKREDLKKLGIEDGDVVDQIMALHGQSVEKFKADLEGSEGSISALQSQLTEATQTIESFKELNVDEIQAAADEWKQKAQEAEETAQKQVHQLKFEHALESQLSSAKAKNVKAVKALLDLEKLELQENGSLKGIDDQLESIKSENDYLFESEEPEHKIVIRGEGKSVIGDSTIEAVRKGAGLPNR